METSTGKMRLCAALFVLALAPSGLAWASDLTAPDHDVRILRDEWGVPHIFGKTDADATFGMGFAQGEDDWSDLQGAILAARGEIASAAGQS